MSIRLKQTLLLLAIALLPALLSAVQSQRRIDDMAASIAATTRSQEMLRERHYLREKVGDIGTGLRLTAQFTEDLLARQARLLEAALQGPEPDQPRQIVYSNKLDGLLPDQPSFLSAAASCTGECSAQMQKLAAAGEGLSAVYRSAKAFSLWHYAGLESGVSVAFPGHGNYPQGYDPRTRPWYRVASAGDGVRWLPLTIDASTGQPVMTAAAPLRAASGELLGVTGIDLPLQELLVFESSAAPWLNSSQLAVLHYDRNLGLRVVARQQALQVDSTWLSEGQSEIMDSIDQAQLAKLRALQQGASTLLENVLLDGEGHNIAFTAMGVAGDSWLALIAPHSATETAVARALDVIDRARADSMQQHLLGAGLIVIIVVLISLYVANRVTAPLIQMSATARELAAGKLDSRTGLQRRDELGVLSSSIDRLADNIERLQLEQEDAYRDMIMTLHRALEKKDAYTAAHSGRVTRVSMKLGRRVGLDEETLEILRFGALTHDLGKIGITDTVLNKPAPLDSAEQQVMRQHPVFSKTIMKPLVRFREYAEIAGSHHEHWDGSGYPDGLKGEEIHLLARIVAIADAWDSMTGDRVYRKGIPVAKALSILEDEVDSGQFDPRLLREFIAMMQQEQDALSP